LKSEVGMRKSEKGSGNLEVGIRTRRRPIGRDYAAAKDAEVGNGNEKLFESRTLGMTNVDCRTMNGGGRFAPAFIFYRGFRNSDLKVKI
jgi:hypothetical protein